jgi:hypothetical protein
VPTEGEPTEVERKSAQVDGGGEEEGEEGEEEEEEEEEGEEEEEDYMARFEEWRGPGGGIRRERCSGTALVVLNTVVPLG